MRLSDSAEMARFDQMWELMKSLPKDATEEQMRPIKEYIGEQMKQCGCSVILILMSALKVFVEKLADSREVKE